MLFRLPRARGIIRSTLRIFDTTVSWKVPISGRAMGRPVRGRRVGLFPGLFGVLRTAHHTTFQIFSTVPLRSSAAHVTRFCSASANNTYSRREVAMRIHGQRSAFCLVLDTVSFTRYSIWPQAASDASSPWLRHALASSIARPQVPRRIRFFSGATFNKGPGPRDENRCQSRRSSTHRRMIAAPTSAIIVI